MCVVLGECDDMIVFMRTPTRKVSGPPLSVRLAPDGRITMTLRLEAKYRDQLAREARRQHVSMNSLIAEALKQVYPPQGWAAREDAS